MCSLRSEHRIHKTCCLDTTLIVLIWQWLFMDDYNLFSFHFKLFVLKQGDCLITTKSLQVIRSKTKCDTKKISDTCVAKLRHNLWQCIGPHQFWGKKLDVY